MLKILDLGPDEIKELDPFHYGRDKLVQRFPSSAWFQPPSRLFNWSPDQFLHAYLPRFCSDADRSGRHAPIVQYDIEMSKKFGPQGGHFTMDYLKTALKQSYEWAEAPRTYDTVLRGVEAMCRMIAVRVNAVGKPTVVYAPFMQDTAAGLPRGGRKTEWRNHVDGASNWRHVQVDLPNGRRQRSKDRVIHEDATLNIDYVMPYLNAVREWLKSQFPSLFAGWLNPSDQLWPNITSHLIKGDTFLETDYSAMDNHFSWETVQRVVLPIYQCLLTDAEYMHFASFIEELFQQPVFLGDTLWTGLHNLFSGQGPTNDFETLYDDCLYLGCHLAAGGSVTTFLDDFAAVGDDCLYSGSELMCQKVYDAVAKEATANGLVLSLEKTRMQHGEARFLRQVYYTALPRLVNAAGREYVWPAYPPILAVNSCVQPEHPANSAASELLADFTRLDGINGYYRKVDVAQLLYSHIAELPLTSGMDAQFEALQMRDWWFKVYGTTYSLGESWSARLYRDHFHLYRLPVVLY